MFQHGGRKYLIGV